MEHESFLSSMPLKLEWAVGGIQVSRKLDTHELAIASQPLGNSAIEE